MTFRNFILILLLAWVFYAQGVPPPIEDFFRAILGAFTDLFLQILALIIKLCLSLANNLQDYGQSLCKFGTCPEWAPPRVRFTQQAAYFGAGLFRGIGKFLMDQGTRFISHNIGAGDTIGKITMWLAVIGA